MKFSKILTFASYLVASTFVAAELTLTPGPVTCEYKNKDLEESYDPKTDVNIKCSGSSCTVNGTGATADSGLVTITAAGTYIVQGSLDGQLRIEALDDDFIHLVLNGASITSSEGPAIYGINANKVTITLVGENELTDSTNYEEVDDEPDACLFIDADLSINGSGSVVVTGNYGDAIRSKKDLKLVNGNISVPEAVQRGIKAKNSVCIKDGTIDINSKNAAIKASRDNDPNKGYISIEGGKISITTEDKGLQAETHLTISGGYTDIKKCVEGMQAQMIDIIGGETHLVASDDGISASKIKDSNSTTSGRGGGWGGPPGAGSSDGSAYVNIMGGKTYITVEGFDTDGIDANGVLYVGGEAELYISHQGGNIYGNMAALDADGSNSIASGATVIATAGGSSSGMGGFPGGGPGGGPPGGMGGQGRPRGQGGMDGQGMPPPEFNNTQFAAGEFPNDMPPPPEFDNQDGMPLPPEFNGNFTDGVPSGMGNDGMSPPDFNSTQAGGFPGRQGGRGGGMGGPPGGMGGPPGEEAGKVYQAKIEASVDNQAAGTEIVIKDAEENVIASFAPIIEYSKILVSSPKMVAGETYTIVMGDTTTTAVAEVGDEGSVDSPSIGTTNTKVDAVPEPSTTTKTNPAPTSNAKKVSCSASILEQGYECCPLFCRVIYEDEDGTWGVHNKEWCGCDRDASKTCPSTVTDQGYPCCSENNCKVVTTDDDGRWGVENNQWCGISDSCKTE